MIPPGDRAAERHRPSSTVWGCDKKVVARAHRALLLHWTGTRTLRVPPAEAHKRRRAVALAFDREQGADALHLLDRDRRLLERGKIDELAAHMPPSSRGTLGGFYVTAIGLRRGRKPQFCAGKRLGSLRQATPSNKEQAYESDPSCGLAISSLLSFSQ